MKEVYQIPVVNITRFDMPDPLMNESLSGPLQYEEEVEEW